MGFNLGFKGLNLIQKRAYISQTFRHAPLIFLNSVPSFIRNHFLSVNFSPTFVFPGSSKVCQWHFPHPGIRAHCPSPRHNSTPSISKSHFETKGLNNSISTVTHYGLDGPGIEARRGRDFPHPSIPDLGSTQPSVHWVPGLLRA
jgi:hypothetical protein